MKFGQAGSPDIVGCYNGNFVGVECKVGKNKPTDLQIEFGKRIVDNGGRYILAYSLDEFIKKLLIQKYGRN